MLYSDTFVVGTTLRIFTKCISMPAVVWMKPEPTSTLHYAILLVIRVSGHWEPLRHRRVQGLTLTVL